MYTASLRRRVVVALAVIFVAQVVLWTMLGDLESGEGEVDPVIALLRVVVIGVALPLLQSETYNKGRAFVAPIPLLTYDFGVVKLNAVFAPQTPQNRFAAFGFYIGIPLAK